jgi:Tfp pilus assembly protein PilZ
MEHLIDESFERRRSRRRRVDTPVRLLSEDRVIPIEGAVTNLGPAGMFVATDEVCQVNAEVVCDVSHPRGREALPVRGRVIWVQDQPAGMGIEFIDLEEPHRSWLQGVVEQRAQGEAVKVWLETLTHPIRATVVHTEEGLHLRAPLPFLRLLSSVVVYPVESPEQGFSGTLDAISLIQGESTTPELRLHLSFEEPELEEPAPEEPAPEEPEPEEPELEEPITLPRQEVVGEFEVRARSVLEIEAEPPVTVAVEQQRTCEDLLQVEEEPYSTELDPPPTDANWSVCLGDMDLDKPEQSQWSLTSEEVESALATAPRKKRGRHVWLWLAASVLVAFTVASMVHTKAWSRAWRWTRARLEAAPAAPLNDELDVAGLPVEGIKPTIVPAEAPAPAIPAAKEPPRAERKASKGKTPLLEQRPLVVSPQPDVVKAPHVITEGQGRELVVPISGSVKDAVHYRLADPDGLVVNLPNARPRVSFGDYPLSDAPFRLIWLRRRDGGLHLRVLFKGKLPQYRLKLRGGAVRVVLEPTTD